MFDRSHFRLFTAPAALMVACSAAPGGPGQPTTRDAKSASIERTAMSAEALTAPFQEFHWSSGQAPLTMWSVNSGYCFLSGVSGDFRGFGEAVWVEMDASQRFWVLRGQAGSPGGDGAWGMCVNWHDINNTQGSNWTWNNWVSTCHGCANSIDLWQGDSGARCFMDGMGGQFDGGGEEALVYETYNGYYSQWIAYTASQHQDGDGTEVDGACIQSNGEPASTYLGRWYWSQGQPSTNMGSASHRICFLTSVTGNFRGGGESVKLTVSNNTWFLGGTSGQGGVSGSADCYTGP